MVFRRFYNVKETFLMLLHEPSEIHRGLDVWLTPLFETACESCSTQYEKKSVFQYLVLINDACSTVFATTSIRDDPPSLSVTNTTCSQRPVG
jgi:hypothetical protein